MKSMPMGREPLPSSRLAHLVRKELLSTPVDGGTLQFRSRLYDLFPATDYILTPDDERMLAVWKEQIDDHFNYWEPIAKVLRVNPDMHMKTSEEEIFRETLMPDFSPTNVRLYCIGEHLMQMRPRWNKVCFGWRNIGRSVLGGTRQVTTIGKKRGKGIDTCSDQAVCAGVLARMYNIEGEIVGFSGDHVFWHQNSDDPEGGACIDLACYWQQRGFIGRLGDHKLIRIDKDSEPPRNT